MTWQDKVNAAYLAQARKPLRDRSGKWWPELDALCAWQKSLVKRALAERNTWEASCIARGWKP